MKAKTGSGGWGRWGGRLLVALALASSCGKDKTTALDIKLQVTGALDQVRIDAVALGGSPISLTAESTLLFPTRARALKTDDVLTLWFPDDADKKTVVVTATGRLCGRDATAPATTAGPTALARGQTIETTLALMNDGTTCSTTDGGAGGTSGGGGAAGGTSGSGGAAAGTGGGTAGTGGIAGTAGAGGSAGGAGGGGAGGGGAGGGGTDGGAGTTGAAGSSGMGGRGGTTGTAGSSGAAGSGGTTGAAGAGGKGGGSGTTGTAGTGAACATAPASASAQLGSLMPGVPTTSCGYPIVGTTVPYLLTGSDFWAQSNAVALANLANCGRCVELVRTMTDGQKRNVVVTLVGGCPDAACQATPTPRFQLSGPAYGVVAPLGENFIPLGANETLTYSFVPCPVQANQPILANMKIAGGAATSVLFVQHRYGIKAVTVENITTAQQFPMTRSNDAYWLPPNGIGLGSSRFHLTDVNNAAVTTSTLPLQNNPPFSPAGTQFPVCPSP